MFTASLLGALPRRLALLFATGAAALALAPAAAAQACPSGTDTFWKVDTLPNIPSGPLAVSVIPGLCEGEGAANVFTLAPGMGPQKLTEVVCPFGSTSGASGFTAAVNVQVFDGVTFSGPSNTPTLGPKVFDFGADFGSNLQVTSHGLNAFDMSPYNVVVGASGMGNFVVAFVMEFNPNGNCASGYNADFFTDNNQPGLFGCDPVVTPPKTSLMLIQGQGWTDASKATVTGVPLCPLFYSGIWAIRACTEDAGALNPLQVAAFPNPIPVGGFSNLTFTAPGYGGVPYLAAASFGTAGIPTVGGGSVPLTLDNLTILSLTAPTIFVNFGGVISPTTETAPGLIFVPNDPSYAGTTFYVAFITIPPAPAVFGISDATQLTIQ